jgi:hypothetical protein
VVSFQGCKDCSTNADSIYVIEHKCRIMDEENHTIISIDAEKVVDTTQLSFMIKT